MKFVRTAVDDIEVEMKTCKDCEHHLGEYDCEVNMPVAYNITAGTCKKSLQRMNNAEVSNDVGQKLIEEIAFENPYIVPEIDQADDNGMIIVFTHPNPVSTKELTFAVSEDGLNIYFAAMDSNKGYRRVGVISETHVEKLSKWLKEDW